MIINKHIESDPDIEGVEPHIALELIKLNFYYGKLHALKDINAKLSRKKITAIIGPSGCGKSTLLRTFNRIYELYPQQCASGKIIFDKQNILSPKIDLHWLRNNFGMVFQKPTPFPMSIFNNVAFALKKTTRLNKKQIRERVEWSLKKAALWDEVKDKLNKSGLALSGGQQQRLCIARVIAIKPKVLLLDEPTSALDPIATLKIEQLVSELKNDFKIIIVTHNLDQAKRISQETWFMLNGKSVELQSTEKLFTTPQDERTQTYISGGL